MPGQLSLTGVPCLQADSPEEMHSWIRAITGAVQALKTRPRVGHALSCFIFSVKYRLYQRMRYLFIGSASLCPVLAGDVLCEVHGPAWGLLSPVPAPAIGGGAQSPGQGPLHVLLAALDAGAAGGGAAPGPAQGVSAGAGGAGGHSRAQHAPEAPLGAAAPQGEALCLRPGR